MTRIRSKSQSSLSRSSSQSSVSSSPRSAETPPASPRPGSDLSSKKGDLFEEKAKSDQAQELQSLREQKLVSPLAKKPASEKQTDPNLQKADVKIGVPVRADGNGGGHQYDLDSIKNIASPGKGANVQPEALPRGTDGKTITKELRQGDDPKKALEGVHGLYIPGAPTANNTQVKAERSNAAADANLNRPPETPKKESDTFKKNEHDSRSEYELKLLNEAQNRGMPILGVCAGSWRVLESYGGRVETLPKAERGNHKASSGNPWDLKHDVETVPGSMLHGITQQGPAKGRQGTSSTLPNVNSTHWAVAQTNDQGKLVPHLPASDPRHKDPDALLEVSARATGAQKENGRVDFTPQTVEGFESRHGAPVMGVQWHPETYQPNMPGADGDPRAVDSGRNIMKAFGESSQTYKNKQELLAEIKQKVPTRD